MEKCETVAMTSITVTLTSADDSCSSDEETRILSTYFVPLVVRIPSDSVVMNRSSRNGNSQDYYQSISQEKEEEDDNDDGSYSPSYYWAGI